MAHHPYVVDLIRIVGRLFYRDEYTVVLDSLAREYALRDDGLEAYFGLPERQIRRILHDLRTEKLVSEEDITERRVRKRDREYDWDAAEKAMMAGSIVKAGGAAAAVRAVNRFGATGSRPGADGGGGSSDSDDDDGGEGGGDGSGKPKSDVPREKRKITTKCWYINPRYFVDVVRFRLHVMRRHLERLESFQGGEAMFRCSAGATCSYECTLLEAQQRRTAELMAAARAAAAAAAQRDAASDAWGVDDGGRGDGTAADGEGRAPAAAATAAGFVCPQCGSALTARHVESIAAAAARVTARLDAQLRSSGLLALLKRLDNVRLGAGRPSDLITAGKISLHGPAAARTAAADAGAGSGSAAGAGDAAPRGRAPAARMFATAASRLDVVIEGDDEHRREMAAAAAAAARVQAAAIAPAVPVAAAALPEHLQRSSITGEASRTLGFVSVVRPGGNGAGEGGAGVHVELGAAAEGAAADGPLRPSWAGGRRVDMAGVGGPGASEAVQDTNVNADVDAAAAAAAADGGGTGAAGSVSNDVLWQLLFAEAEREGEVVAGAGEPASGAAAATADDDEWEDA